MNKIEKDLNKDFQQRPKWVFIMLIITLIGVAPNFSELILDFFPTLTNCKKWIKLLFIVIALLILGSVYWLEEQIYLAPDKISKDELLEKIIKKAKWFTWQQNIFNHYPLNIITFRIFPLFICWAISLLINKNYKSYLFDSFDFPRYWEKSFETPEEKEKYNYEKVISEFFETMFRVYIENLNQSYEIKFSRDFQHIEIRWNNKSGEKFNNTKKDLYDKIFSEEAFKNIKIFTWIFPFGLYWNLRRRIKQIILKIKNYKRF